MLRPFVAAGLLGVSYLAFSSSVSVAEIVAAVLSGAAGGLLAFALGRSDRPYRYSLPDLGRRLPRILASVLRDAIVLSRAFALAAVGRLPPGSVVSRPFATRPGTAAARGRRAMAIWGLSLAPNSFVLNVDYETDTVAVHRIVPSEPHGDPRWPL